MKRAVLRLVSFKNKKRLKRTEKFFIFKLHKKKTHFSKTMKFLNWIFIANIYNVNHKTKSLTTIKSNHYGRKRNHFESFLHHNWWMYWRNAHGNIANCQQQGLCRITRQYRGRIIGRRFVRLSNPNWRYLTFPEYKQGHFLRDLSFPGEYKQHNWRKQLNKGAKSSPIFKIKKRLERAEKFFKKKPCFHRAFENNDVWA